jgi:hypothetical protein
MASISGAVFCAAVATLFWTGLGFAMTRRLVPATLAMPLAPVIGFAVHSALALPVFFVVPFTPAVIAAVAVFILVAAVVASSRILPPLGEKPPVHVPAWSYGLAALLALAPAAAVLPKLSGGAVFLADPIFDHAKVALIDDMTRLGVAPGNPFFADGGPFAYYYLWHFSAAEVARLLGVSGWEADAGLTWFSAFASLTAMMGLAVWLSRRPVAAPLALLFAATASGRYLLWDLFGAENVDAVLSRPAGFAGFLFQSPWVPQHIISAALAMVAIYLIAQLAHHRNAIAIVTLGLIAAAGFESSTWIGGFAFAASTFVAVPLLFFSAGRSARGRFFGALVLAAIIAAVATAPFLRDQVVAVAARSTDSPITVMPHYVFGEAVPDWLHRLLDPPGFWLVFLPVELAAIYIPGIMALVAFLSCRDLDPDRRRAVIALAALAAASLTISWLLASTLADNNDLGWRAVLPGAMALTVFSAAGLARWIAARTRTAVAVTAVAILVGLPGAAELIRSDMAGRREADARLFAQTPEMWAAVRRHAGPDERIANNPLFLADMTLWPVDISWALLADRRSCYAGRELVLVYASLPRPRLDEIDAQFIRVFAGKAEPGDIDDLATKYGCRLVVLTSADGVWASDPFAAHPRYRLVEERPGAWRIYRVIVGEGER